MSVVCKPRAPPYILHVRLSSAFTYQTAWLVYKRHRNVTSAQRTVNCFKKIRRHIVDDLCRVMWTGSVTIPSSVFVIFLSSSVQLFLSLQGLCASPQNNMSSGLEQPLLPSFPLSYFLLRLEVRLFILPQTDAVLGVDVKVPGACGAKGVHACDLLVCVYLCAWMLVFTLVSVRVGVSSRWISVIGCGPERESVFLSVWADSHVECSILPAVIWPHKHHLAFFNLHPSFAACVRRRGTDGAWEKLAHSPPLSTLQHSLLSSLLPSSLSLLIPSFLSPPLCLVAPLIHYISTPLLRPPHTPSPIFFFLVHNM